MTNSTTGDLVFMGGTKFYPVYAESSRWNTLMHITYCLFASYLALNKWCYVISSCSAIYHSLIFPDVTFLHYCIILCIRSLMHHVVQYAIHEEAGIFLLCDASCSSWIYMNNPLLHKSEFKLFINSTQLSSNILQDIQSTFDLA